MREEQFLLTAIKLPVLDARAHLFKKKLKNPWAWCALFQIFLYQLRDLEERVWSGFY